MARTKRGVVSRAKHNKVLKSSKRSKRQKKKHYSYSTTSNGKSDAICLQRQKKQKKRI